MSGKPGRNEPCPCGSGKKYKKCCGAQEKFDCAIPEEFKTNTILDEYMILMQGIGLFGQSLRQFDEERRGLNKSVRDFEECFCPGDLGGVPDSIFMPWYLLDLRFGKSQKTVCERFIESEYANRLREPGPELLNNLSNSYLAFYLLKGFSDDYLTFEEIGTRKKWITRRINDPYERASKTGDLWYVRLIGNADEAYVFSAPYIFPPDGKMLKDIRGGVEFQTAKWSEYPGRSLDQSRDFCDSSKASVIFWLSNILDKPLEMPDRSAITHARAVVNTDREKLHFSEIFFKILYPENIQKKLSGIKGFEYDKETKQWMWFKRTKKNIKMYSKTIGGTVKIKGSLLIAETNSLPRALKIKAMIQKALGTDVEYEKIEAKDMASLPPLSKEEQEIIDKKTAELNSDPEIQVLLQKQLHDYYHKSWLRQKIPALGYITPYAAAKTKEGRKLLEKLLEGIEERQNRSPDNVGKIDINELRRKLKLIQ